MNRKDAKGRKEKGRYLMFFHAMLNHPDYLSLSPYAKVLLIDIAMQYNGINNGDFGASWTVMKKRGWKSEATLSKKLKELQEKNFIVKTRQGGLHVCSLYAVTWVAVDDCKGKLDISATKTPLRKWK